MDRLEPILHRILNLLESFTQQGMPLAAQTMTKREHQVSVVLAGFLANPQLAATMMPEEMVEAAIHYASLIDEKLSMAMTPESRIHALERLMHQGD
jgi:hypothetical protein